MYRRWDLVDHRESRWCRGTWSCLSLGPIHRLKGDCNERLSPAARRIRGTGRRRPPARCAAPSATMRGTARAAATFSKWPQRRPSGGSLDARGNSSAAAGVGITTSSVQAPPSRCAADKRRRGRDPQAVGRIRPDGRSCGDVSLGNSSGEHVRRAAQRTPEERGVHPVRGSSGLSVERLSVCDRSTACLAASETPVAVPHLGAVDRR